MDFYNDIKPNENHIMRMAYSKASMWFFIYDSKLNVNITRPAPVPGFQEFQAFISGNKSLDPLSMNLLEFGYKLKINNRSIFDIEIFEIKSKNYSSLIQGAIAFAPPKMVQKSMIENTSVEVVQLGTTLSYTYNSSKLSLKPFITFQKTDLKDFSPYYNTEEVNPEKNINTISDFEHKGTPKAFGGLIINYRPIKKLNLYFNPYFLGESSFIKQEAVTAPEKGTANIESQFLLNAKIGYSLSKDLVMFFNARNMFSNEKYQHYYTDRIKASYYFGINFNL